MFEQIVFALLIPLGLICLFRPILLLYLFSAFMVVKFAPAADFENTPMLRLGSVNIFAEDYLTMILFFLLLAIVARNLVAKRHLLRGIIDGRISKSIFALFLWSVFIGILSYTKGFALQNVLRHLSAEALMFIAVLVPTIAGADEKKERFFRFSIALGLTLVVFALWKYLVSHDIEITSSGTARTLLGNTVVIFLLPICYLLFYRGRRQSRSLAWSAITLMSVGIALTGHRSGLLTLAVVLLLYFMTSDFRLKDYLWIPTSGLTLLILVALLYPSLRLAPGQTLLGDLVLRAGDTFNLENKTSLERLSKWDFSLEVAKRHPLLGLGRFPVHTDSIADDSNLDLKSSFDDFNKATHNIFAEQLANTGLLGLSVLALFLFFIFRQLSGISPQDRGYANFLKFYFLAFLVFSQFNTSFSDPLGKIFLFTMLGFANLQKLKEASPLPAHCRTGAAENLGVTSIMAEDPEGGGAADMIAVSSHMAPGTTAGREPLRHG